MNEELSQKSSKTSHSPIKPKLQSAEKNDKNESKRISSKSPKRKPTKITNENRSRVLPDEAFERIKSNAEIEDLSNQGLTILSTQIFQSK